MRTRVLLASLAIAFASIYGSAAYAGPPGGGYDGGHCGGQGLTLGYGGGAGYGWAYGMGIAGLYNGLDNYTDYRVPYFAAHPPVYYSYPVPRTYGYSPFAYPPHFSTPDMCAPLAPVTINNPYVPASETSEASDKPSDETVSAPQTAAPLMVYNPFVTDSVLASIGR